MTTRINTNIAAFNAHRQLVANDSTLGKSLQRLASGRRVNGASDDAAGLAISEKMAGQIRGLSQSQRNAQDTISMLQTAEGALDVTTSMLQRMRELTVQAKNGTLVPADRTNLAWEIVRLYHGIDQIASDTEFNTRKLLDGSLSTAGLTFQIGANAGQVINFTLGSAFGSSLSLPISYDPVTQLTYVTYDIASYDYAIDLVSSQRSKIGALINRLEHAVQNLGISEENTASAQSRIVDLDMAREVVSLSRSQILTQSATSMLAQANQSSQGVLSLLR